MAHRDGMCLDRPLISKVRQAHGRDWLPSLLNSQPLSGRPEQIGKVNGNVCFDSLDNLDGNEIVKWRSDC